MSFSWVPSMLISPLLGAVALILMRIFGNALNKKHIKPGIALFASGWSFVSVIGWVSSGGWKSDVSALSIPWIPDFSIRLEAGGDGVTALFALLISLVFPALILSEWRREKGQAGVLGALLVLQTLLLGATSSENLFVTAFFWTATALPLFFLVSMWGGERRGGAAYRSFISAGVGNTFVLASILLYYFASDDRSFSLPALWGGKQSTYAFGVFGHELPLTTASFILFSLGFFLRLPVAPAHAWAPAFAKEAPPSALGAHYGAFLPITLGLYGKLSFGLFPKEVSEASGWLLGFGIFNILYGALGVLGRRSPRETLVRLALVQTGLALTGFCARSVPGLVGPLLSITASGIAFTGLSLLIGSTESRGWGSEPRGLIAKGPALAIMGSTIFAALMQVPGTYGFVGQAITALGVYPFSAPSAWILLLGAIVVAAGVVGLYRSVFFGEEDGKAAEDASLREKAALFPLCLILVVLGLYPTPVLDLIRQAAERWISWVH